VLDDVDDDVVAEPERAVREAPVTPPH